MTTYREVVSNLNAIKRVAEKSEAGGQLTLHMQGGVEGWEKVLANLKRAGWSVNRHYVSIGQIQVAILID